MHEPSTHAHASLGAEPTILLVAGYPKPDCRVPVHGGIKKPLGEIASWL